jgi:hypothetical protein
VLTGRWRVGQLVRERIRRGVLAFEQILEPVHGIARQRRRVGPPFAERRLDVADGRAADRHLDVVPGRALAVLRGHGHRLRVAEVLGVVPAAVAQVDAAHVGDVERGPARVAQHDELLVVRAAAADPHVAQALAAGRLDPVPEVAVFRGAERQPIPVRTPDQPLDDHPALGRFGENRRDLGAGAVEPFVRVAPPVGEQQQVAFAQAPDFGEQLGVVRGALDQRSDLVIGRNGPLAGIEEPIHLHV